MLAETVDLHIYIFPWQYFEYEKILFLSVKFTVKLPRTESNRDTEITFNSIQEKMRGRGCSSMVEHFPSLYKALGLIPSKYTHRI
jgi:hypothetical protein